MFVNYDQCVARSSLLTNKMFTKKSNIVGFRTYLWCIHSVVCLRGGERGTCLGPSLRYYAHKFSLFLVKDVLFTHVMCYKANHKQVFCFQRTPLQKLWCAGTLLSKGPQQQLKYVCTLLFNFIEVAPKRNCSVQVLYFQRGPQQQV